MRGQVQFNSSTVRLINGTQANSQQVVEDDHSLQDVKLVLKIINMWATQKTVFTGAEISRTNVSLSLCSLSLFLPATRASQL